MNITLAAPPSVIQNVRCWAEEQGTSLNQYIRDLLIAKDREIRLERKSLADREIRLERKSLADEFYSFAMANSIEMEPGYKYSRADAAERLMECDK